VKGAIKRLLWKKYTTKKKKNEDEFFLKESTSFIMEGVIKGLHSILGTPQEDCN